MKSFSKLYSDFWINCNNTELMDLGIDAQLVALYLQGNHHRNILGAYYLPLLYMASDLKLSVEQVQTSLEKLCKINYCKYDCRTQYIWVCNLAFEQIGEDVGSKDNRIKALQSIWKSLPAKLEFLEEIYNKYQDKFHLKRRAFENPTQDCEIQKEEPTVSTPITNTTPNIQSAERLLPVVPPFEGASESLESLSEDKSTDIFLEKSFEVPSEVPHGACKIVTDFFGTTIVVQDPISLPPSKGLISLSEGPLNPFESPFEGALDPLSSNIEDRSKNIEDRNKKEEIEEELEKEKRRNINNTQVLNLNIVAQARRCVDDQPNKFSSFLEKPNEIDEKSLTQSQNQDQSNLPVILLNLPNPNPEAKPKSKNIISKTSIKNSVNASVVAVFEHWKTTMKHPRANLDQNRRDLICQALEWGYSVEEICEAITGCFRTPFYMKENPRGQYYTGLHIILRDADQIDKFIKNCHSPPKPKTEAEQKLQSSLYVADKWVDYKRNESTIFVRNNDD